MSEELRVCAAAFFRGIGKDVTTPDEFVMGTSLSMKWMSPSESKLLLKALTSAGILESRDGYVRPVADLSGIDVPLAYRPPKELVESLHAEKPRQERAETPKKEDADAAPADLFPTLMSKAVEAGMERRDFIQSCNKIQKRLDIEVAVAALIVLRDAGADVGPYLDAVYGSIRVGRGLTPSL